MLSYLTVTFTLALLVAGVLSWLLFFYRCWFGLKSLATRVGIELGW